MSGTKLEDLQGLRSANDQLEQAFRGTATATSDESPNARLNLAERSTNLEAAD